MTRTTDFPRFKNAITALTPELKALRSIYIAGGSVSAVQLRTILSSQGLRDANIADAIQRLANTGLVEIRKPWWARSLSHGNLLLTDAGMETAIETHRQATLSTELAVASKLYDLNDAQRKLSKTAKGRLLPVSYSALEAALTPSVTQHDLRKAIDVLFDRGLVRRRDIDNQGSGTPGLLIAGEAEALVRYVNRRVQ
jgi:hypothetical protein